MVVLHPILLYEPFEGAREKMVAGVCVDGTRCGIRLPRLSGCDPVQNSMGRHIWIHELEDRLSKHEDRFIKLQAGLDALLASR